ncbi:hypothetical protein [Proteus hauseri]|uniref:hypothetical protein n=1 Tax=Proteus hauseri TaxID=183417 RepID=UPI0010094C94|nr:hypothetical protein [Proteus hauseri]QAV22037.1 hypothetical protein PH4a_01165 [Proteus hauseri]
MKIKLLNNARYKSLASLKYPIIVLGSKHGDMIEVKGDQFHLGDRRDTFLFVVGTECEVIHE